MPQTTVEKKFFRVRVTKNCQNPEAIICQSIAVTEFQEVQQNLAGGEK